MKDIRELSYLGHWNSGSSNSGSLMSPALWPSSSHSRASAWNVLLQIACLFQSWPRSWPRAFAANQDLASDLGSQLSTHRLTEDGVCCLIRVTLGSPLDVLPLAQAHRVLEECSHNRFFCSVSLPRACGEYIYFSEWKGGPFVIVFASYLQFCFFQFRNAVIMKFESTRQHGWNEARAAAQILAWWATRQLVTNDGG